MKRFPRSEVQESGAQRASADHLVCAGVRSARICPLVSQGVVVLILCMSVVSCGGAGSQHYTSDTHKTKDNGSQATATKYPVTYLAGGVQTLVRERLSTGYSVLTAVRYRYKGGTYSALRQHVEEPGVSGTVSAGGSGRSMAPEGHGPVEIGIVHGCVGVTGYALAYGMLRSPGDTVTALDSKGAIRFRKVVIPAKFYPHGVLVYASLAPGPVELVVTTPSGSVVSKERYPGAQPVCRFR
jgi:hypothetical protein